LTLLVGLGAHRLGPRRLLLPAALLMAATGVGFAAGHAFWPLAVVAFVGTLNPSTGDVSVFLPLEQALLPQTGGAPGRTALLARSSRVGWLRGAAGALCAGLPAFAAARTGLGLPAALQAMFLLYAALGLVAFGLYRALPAAPAAAAGPAPGAAAPLRESRRT